MQYLAIITMDLPGQCAATLATTIDVTGPCTRLDLYKYMRDEVVKNYGEKFAHASVVYFSAEPNKISA